MSSMYANELDTPAPLAERPLQWRTAPKPEPAERQLLIEVAGCGVCRSNLHMIEGEWVDAGVPAISPIVPGHEVTGRVAELGAGVSDFAIGDPVGVQPLWWTCEECEFCTSGREHLCHERKITGEHVDGGYGEYMLCYAAHTYHVPENLDLVERPPRCSAPVLRRMGRSTSSRSVPATPSRCSDSAASAIWPSSSPPSPALR